MPNTLQNTIDFSQCFINYSPLTAGTGNNPAVTIATMLQNTITNAPFTWPWNRGEDSSTSTVIGTQDYIIGLTDFNFLEKLSLTDISGNIFEVTDVLNTNSLSKATKRQRPTGVSVISINYGTNVKIRFVGVPDAVYVINLTYQKLVIPITTLTQNWSIPDHFSDIYNNLFLAEAFQDVDDARAFQYRQRGVAVLLAKAEGLTEMQKNIFMEQFLATDSQTASNGMRTQQYNQARGA